VSPPLNKYKRVSIHSFIHSFILEDQTPGLVQAGFLHLFFFFGGNGILNSGLCRHSTTYATLPVHFALVILKMGSHKLFAWAGLKL
jgi:hypothetical protein